ncbi:MAG: hypothetical protein GY851_20870, partial [bacterium]|nr:hypothetical protein [bacterium]
SERLKAVAGTMETGLIPFVSEDGVRWRKLREDPIITQGELDSQNLVFWSESEQCYCCYLRKWASDDAYGGLRSVARCTSPDFLHWSDIEAMTFGDTEPEELYTNQTLPYFRAPHIYVAIAARFMRDRRVLSPEQFVALGGEGHYGDDCSDAVLLTSRGGTVYDRTFMEGFVRPGIGLSNWTSRTNYPVWGLIPTSDSEMSFYITRDYGQPSVYLERLVLRTDGFASVHAPYTGGEMLTKPVTFSGQSLMVNYSTSAAGSLRAELQDETGQPLPGYAIEDADEIIGDEIARTVTWRNDANLAGLADQAVRLRFAMKDADLYSIKFT